MEAAATESSNSDLDAELLRVASLSANKRATEALAALQQLQSQYPKSGRLREKIGDCYRDLGFSDAALGAYRQAVACNDALPDSWYHLESLYRAKERHTEADEAARSAARLAALPADLARASYLLNEGELDSVEEIARGYLRRHGPHAQGMRILAQTAIKLNVLDDAEMLLENVLAIQPDYDDARFEYASVLCQRRRYLPALHEVRRLLAKSPGNPLFQLLYGAVCDGLGESEEALETYRRLSAASPADANLLLSMAQVLKTRGDTSDAVALFKRAARTPACFSGACLALSNTKTYRFTDEEISAMRAGEALPGATLVDRYQLCFALGKAFEDRCAYETSFSYYARGNALKRSETKSDAGVVEQAMRRQAAVCTSAFFAARQGMGCTRPDPIFIVGMPRAGSTLLEQILASHTQIDGTLELPDIPRLVQQFRNRDRNAPPRYPAILGELSADDFNLLGQTYLDDTRPFRKGAPFFIDKMPSNFRDIGLIHLILPNAKIIDARREPMACCFGNFKQLFTNGMEFNYSLEEIGRYYCNYVSLMRHWDRALPGKVLRVQHEDVVNDLEFSVRRLLDFVGVPFEPACLEFHKTVRAVRTVSSEQVRRPIYREGLDQWRHFEPWLGPLRSALEPLQPS